MIAKSRIAVAALFVSQITAPAHGQQPPPVANFSANPEASTQRNTPEGLKAFLTETLAAVKSDDAAKYSAYFSTLALPNNGDWLVKEFGPAEGPNLKAKYVQLRPQAPEYLKRLFTNALQDGRTDVTVKTFAQGTEPKIGVIRAALKAMVEPAQIYTAEGANPVSAHSVALGNFVYVDGAFRFLSGEVLRALSTAPIVRIRVGGNVAAAKLVDQIQPVYPPEAVANHIRGTVRLHVVVAVGGTPQEVTVISGDELLAASAVTAVRHWRYQQTMLNGAPVEVDTTVDVVYK